MGAVDRTAYNALWREKNREKLRAYQREYMRARRAADPEKNKQLGREHGRLRRARNPEAVRAYGRKSYHSLTAEQKLERAIKNRTSSAEAIKAAAKRWAAKNPGKKNAETAKRRARLLQATPSWADLKSIQAIYVESTLISDRTGVRHEVDHIIPLQGKLCCGLHVSDNLQIIPAVDNRRKGATTFAESVAAISPWGP